jgi:hypothetical protein
MDPHAAHRLSEDEYLTRERVAATKSEYLNGQVFAMAGGSPRHNLIVANVTAAMGHSSATGLALSSPATNGCASTRPASTRILT